MKRIWVAVAAIIGMTAGMALAGTEAPSVARGAELFVSTSLGTSGESCAECHPAGKGLEDVSDYNDARLGEVTNACVTKGLQGKALGADSVELRSLILYLRSLAAK
jgi:cytochrome c